MRSIFLLLTLAALSTLSCNRQKESEAYDPSYSRYIAAFSQSPLSTYGDFRIRFTVDIPGKEAGVIEHEALMDISPGVEGRLEWLDASTIHFLPSAPLLPDHEYRISFDLASLIAVPDSLSRFSFSVQTRKQELSLEEGYLEAVNTEDYRYSGSLITADFAPPELLEKCLEIYYRGEPVKPEWRHEEGGLKHHFLVDRIKRGSEMEQMRLQWNGKSIAADDKGKLEIDVPGRGAFKYAGIKIFNYEEQKVEVYFTDPLDAAQDITGLIQIEGITGLQHAIRGNKVVLYVPGRQSGSYRLKIHPGIRSVSGRVAGTTVLETLLFEELKPSIWLPGEGNILPLGKSLVFPFDAVNLNAVDVTILKIYESNMLSFLQRNSLAGSNELYRTGDIILQKKIELKPENPQAIKTRSRYGIDLSKIIRAEPGALYRVVLSFRPEYSAYMCSRDDFDDISDTYEDDYYYYDESSQYFHDLYPGYKFKYDWRHRDDPCYRAYYRTSRFVSRNILASNLAMTAMQGSDGQTTFILTDIRNARPRKGVKVTIYSYRMQELGSALSDGSGLARIDWKEKPAFAVAGDGKEKAYLRLDPGEALSVSRFETGGVSAQSGLKGRLYGERDVWRPGDSLFLTFVLEDLSEKLPLAYPVHFALRDPQGREVINLKKLPDEGRFYTFRLASDPDWITGRYLATVSAGGLTVNQGVRIETIKPNRLKIDFEGEGDKIWGWKGKNHFTLRAQWLHGASAGGLKYKVESALKEQTTSFPSYRDFHFRDESEPFYDAPRVVAEGELDEQGEADLSLSLQTSNRPPGILKAAFKIRVFENSGNFSVRTLQKDFYPYEAYAGFKLPEGNKWTGALATGKKEKIDMVLLDAEGNPLPGQLLRAKLYKLEWRWWWHSSGENIASYINNRFLEPVKAVELRTDARGKAEWTLAMDDNEWGRYFLWVEDVKGGHRSGKVLYFDNPYYSGRSREGMAEGASMLPLSLDKDKYMAGERAVLTIPVSKGSRALVTLQGSTGVISAQWWEAGMNKDVIQVPLATDRDMAPNIYVHVMLLQEHSRSLEHLPIRQYGIIPLMVENAETKLEPRLQTADVYRPEESVSIEVSEEKGRPMTYTLALVDEGLLGITGFRTPDLWNYFYAKQALGVHTWDIFDRVLGAFGEEMAQLLSLGGGEAAEPDPDKAKVNRFKPVVRFLGPFRLEAGKSRIHSVRIPRYVGALRVMLVAGDNGKYGSADKEVPVRKPLMVLSTAPRVLRPGEQVRLPVEVFAMENKIKDVELRISGTQNLQFTGGMTKRVHFDAPGSKLVFFEAVVGQRLEPAAFAVEASGNGEKAVEQSDIPVLPSNPEISGFSDYQLEAGGTFSEEIKALGIPGSNRQSIEVSTLPPMNLGQRMDYLMRYPYGCVEQVTSALFPQLYLGDFMDLSEEKRKEAEENIQAGIRKLMQFQNSGGGLSYWPGYGEISDWGTSYGGHFMLEAEKKGYRLPPGFKESWILYQVNAANNWNPSHTISAPELAMRELQQAYRLYTLALSGQAALGAMNRLKLRPNLSAAARWRLAAAYAMAGQESVARELTRGAPVSFTPYRDFRYTYGSLLRDQAMALETMVLTGDPRTLRLVKKISTAMASKNWYSTQTTAYCLIALSRYASEAEGGMQFSLTINGKPAHEVKSNKVIWSQDMADDSRVVLSNRSAKPLFVRILRSGIPPAGGEEADARKVQLRVRYLTTDGEALDVRNLVQGTDFLVEVEIMHQIRSGYRYDRMALTQIWPSGWEISNARMDELDYSGNDYDKPEYMDIRDDRIYSFFNLGYWGKKKFLYRVSATYAGRYYLPAVRVEAMYDNEIYANTQGQWVEVSEPGRPREAMK